MAKIALGILQEKDFTAELQASLSLMLGKATVVLDGDGVISGADSQLRLGGAEVLGGAELRTVAGTDYLRLEGGPWTRQPASSHFSVLITELPDLTDAGMATWEGVRVHRLVPPEGYELGPLDLGVVGPGRGFTRALELFADDEGTPVNVTLNASWQAEFLGIKGGPKTRVPAEKHLDISFSEVDGPVGIDPPR